ncbi:6-carboxytetrahydropterin synthase [Actinoplanes sp. N902-109]|uniref:6-pyruvoyl trahydropterin synthase family protein n=1 Tax=Actinoplanes sp. (strain N902-109) TaxID=649831 RepID=UPI00032961FB|nr:6-carboxytetrahydropterin synthase [Actinoplanes sp. N902-109]AGL12168.1 6-pyruvoyl tetrahydrobiopterin synthase [Actinoplanes sp. N902-109]AGL16484.1 6-pyruvoyl tetrahydropterin synthase protein [Actinoplanes sp. N902-109]
MGFRITKKFEFSASHQLSGLAPDHQCARLHGHNYVIELELGADETELSPVGFVRDYGELSPFKVWLDATLDHRHLNDVLTENPTAENMAAWIYRTWSKEFSELTCVRVSETPKTWAEYRP